ncbi:hypothetical protein [Candidatus Poriferisocius sp.]|uniref:hypothetical protein n=1 Tax=Candidatus Poriferisocius sp. TaxID=3101276 RepID=UPI003B010D39
MKLVVVAETVLLALSCSGGSGHDLETAQPENNIAIATQSQKAPALPETGVKVTMARGNWIETSFQHHVVQLLLEELGYEVSYPVGEGGSCSPWPACLLFSMAVFV